MYCSQCGNELRQQDLFCSTCGNPSGNRDVIKTTGGENVTIAGNNKISNSSIQVGDIYLDKTQDEKAYIDREYIKPLLFFNRPVKLIWLVIFDGICFIGSLVSIISFLTGQYPGSPGLLALFFALLPFLLFSILLKICRDLAKRRFSRFFLFNFEATESRTVFISIISGTCPKCGGRLKLVDLGPANKSKKTYVQCSRNENHIWDFDPTIFDEKNHAIKHVFKSIV